MGYRAHMLVLHAVPTPVNDHLATALVDTSVFPVLFTNSDTHSCVQILFASTFFRLHHGSRQHWCELRHQRFDKHAMFFHCCGRRGDGEFSPAWKRAGAIHRVKCPYTTSSRRDRGGGSFKCAGKHPPRKALFEDYRWVRILKREK